MDRSSNLFARHAGSVGCPLLLGRRRGGMALVATRIIRQPVHSQMSFDQIVPDYHWMELLLAASKLHRCRTAFLDQPPPPANILLLGEGHGRSLVEFRRRFVDAQITCVDASAGMLIQARRQLTRHDLEATRVEFIHAMS